MIAWVRCLLRGRHEPLRHPLGFFRCSECGASGADLDEMGFVGEGYVPSLRRRCWFSGATTPTDPRLPERLRAARFSPRA